MNRAVSIVVLSVAIAAHAVSCPQKPGDSGKTVPEPTAPVLVKVDARVSFGSLETNDRADVQKYEMELKSAGLSVEEITLLVDDEVQVRLALRKAPAPSAPSGSPPAVVSPGPGMGPYVGARLAEGLRGRELAEAIHAEQARRRGPKGQGTHGTGHDGPGDAGPKATTGHGTPGNEPPGAGKAPSPKGPEEKGPAQSGKGTSGQPSGRRPPAKADAPAPRPPHDGPQGKPEGQGGQGRGRGNKPGGKSRGSNPKDDEDG